MADQSIFPSLSVRDLVTAAPQRNRFSSNMEHDWYSDDNERNVGLEVEHNIDAR